MTEPRQNSSDLVSHQDPDTALRRAILVPLWIAALSLAVIATVLIVSGVELTHALRATQDSLAQLQQQVSQLKSGLGGILGG